MPESPFYVIIATANREQLLSRTLRSLSACEKPSSYRATIVVENGRKGETETVVNQFAQDLSTRYLYMEEGNKSKALNHALQMLDEGLIFFTDDDVRLHPNTLVAYAGAAEGRGGGRFYGGPTDVDYEAPPLPWLKDYLPCSATGLEYAEDQVRGDRLCQFLGFNWAAFAGDLRRTGGFNPRYGPGSPTGSRGQESDMQRRLWQSGIGPVYVPDARVWHYVPKHRCSPRWALERAFQDGVESGLTESSEESGLFGVPDSMIRVWLREALNAAKKSIASCPEERFAAYYSLLRYSGVVRGRRLIHSDASASDPLGGLPRHN